MNNPIVRIVLAMLIGALLGYSIAVGPGLYQQMMDHRTLLEDMATNPAYRVIGEVEGYNPRITVLNVMDAEARDGSIVTMWIFHDSSGIEEDEWLPYLIDTLAHMWQTLADAYPTKSNYAIVFAQLIMAPTIEGNIPQIQGISVYIMDRYSLSRFLAEPTGDTLDILYNNGKLIFEWIGNRSVMLIEVLPREPGYIAPWDNDADCNTCN